MPDRSARRRPDTPAATDPRPVSRPLGHGRRPTAPRPAATPRALITIGETTHQLLRGRGDAEGAAAGDRDQLRRPVRLHRRGPELGEGDDLHPHRRHAEARRGKRHLYLQALRLIGASAMKPILAAVHCSPSRLAGLRRPQRRGRPDATTRSARRNRRPSCPTSSSAKIPSRRPRRPSPRSRVLNELDNEMWRTSSIDNAVEPVGRRPDSRRLPGSLGHSARPIAARAKWSAMRLVISGGHADVAASWSDGWPKSAERQPRTLRRPLRI